MMIFYEFVTFQVNFLMSNFIVNLILMVNLMPFFKLRTIVPFIAEMSLVDA